MVIFSLFTLVGCSGNTDAVQKELAELQQTVADLQGQLTEQTQTVAAQAEKIAELEAAKAAQAETIAALQNAENLSAEEIAALEAQLATQQQQIEELENFKKKIEFSEEIPCSVGFLERPNEQYHLFLMQDYYLASSKEDWETLLFLREELSQEELNAKYTEGFFIDKFLIVAYSQQVCYEFQPAEINLYKKYDYQADAFFYEIVITQSKNAVLDGSTGAFTILEVEKEYYENISVKMKSVKE